MTTDSTTTRGKALDLLTISETADLLRVSTKTIYRLVDRRALAFSRVSGALRFSRADIEALLSRGRVESVDPKTL